jgi:alpha-beta hydrolase superfamily lysophospholipase
VISYQGTESAKQAQADLNLSLMNISHVCSGCTTHTGFWQSWNESRQLVLQATHDLRIKFPNNRIIATGHSLGGAIATLAAAELRASGMPIDLVIQSQVELKLHSSFFNAQAVYLWSPQNRQPEVGRLYTSAKGKARRESTGNTL